MSPAVDAPGVSWDEVVGQPSAVRILTGALRRGEVGHAWLFVGRPGVGQSAAARALAAALNCPESGEATRGCGDCPTCARLARGTHPVMRDLAPEGAQHRVDEVREEWIPAASRTPGEGTTKVLRVLEADRMNETAQNAVLKALEEPPGFTVWVLQVEDDTALLETVTSRCRRIDFTAPALDAMRELASRGGASDEWGPVAARAAMGSPGRLRALLDQGPGPRERHLELTGRLARQGPGVVPQVAGELRSWAKDRAGALDEPHERQWEELLDGYGVEHRRDLPPGVAPRLTKRQKRQRRQARAEALLQVLDDLGSWLRDVAATAGGTRAGRPGWINADHAGRLPVDADRLGLDGALTCLRAVGECRDALDRNGHTQLQLERLLLRLAIELYRERGG